MSNEYNAIEYYTKEGWRVTSPFGNRTSPITGATQLHTGVDFGGKTKGAEVKTPFGGKVVGVGEYPVRGKTVTIRIAEDILQITQHHDAFKVKVGDVVRTGDVIATNGISGSVTGPHIHYELRQDVPSLSGRPIGRYLWGDPAKYFATGDFSRLSYVVESGDTLYTISKQFEVTVEQLREWNGRTSDQDKSLSVGTKLWIEPNVAVDPITLLQQELETILQKLTTSESTLKVVREERDLALSEAMKLKGIGKQISVLSSQFME